MTLHLSQWRKAVDIQTSDNPLSGKCLRFENPIAAIVHAMNSVAGSIKSDSMNVDFQSLTISENKSMGRSSFLNCESLALQDREELWNVSNTRDNIDIFVWSSLRLQQRIDTPATVKPHSNPRVLKQTKHPHYISGVHFLIHAISFRSREIRSPVG